MSGQHFQLLINCRCQIHSVKKLNSSFNYSQQVEE